MSEIWINLKKQQPQGEAIQLIPEDMARKYNAIPVAIGGNTLTVAMANPADVFALEALATQSHLRIEPMAATTQEIQESIDFNYKDFEEIEKKVATISLADEIGDQNIKFTTVTDAPVAQALVLIIDEAVKSRASDIHLQPQEDRLRVRYRIDGTLHDAISLPVATSGPLISRVKVLAAMNIADEAPRPGRSVFGGRQGPMIDIRVGTTPTVYGNGSPEIVI
jgi:general secretion pathway protein E